MTQDLNAYAAKAKATHETQTLRAAPLRDAVVELAAAHRATRQDSAPTPERVALLDLCNHEAGVLYRRALSIRFQPLFVTALNQATRALGADPDTIDTLHIPLAEQEQSIAPFVHALAAYGSACYGPGRLTSLDPADTISVLALASAQDRPVLAVGLTEDTQRHLADAITGVAAQLAGVAS